LWAVVVVTVVVTILGSAVGAHALMERWYQARLVVSAPAVSTLEVVAVAHAEAGALFTVHDPTTGNLATLASQREPSCPPVNVCQYVRPDAFILLKWHNWPTHRAFGLDRRRDCRGQHVAPVGRPGAPSGLCGIA
jgi:hypothetical protein